MSCDAKTETCGTKALRTRSFTWPLVVCCPDGVGEGDLTVEPVGEKTEPLTVVGTGVAVPEAPGEPELGWVGREVVEA